MLEFAVSLHYPAPFLSCSKRIGQYLEGKQKDRSVFERLPDYGGGSTRSVVGCFFFFINFWNFRGGLVVRTPCFHCRGPGFDPWSGN